MGVMCECYVSILKCQRGGGVCMARVVRCDVLLALDLTSL